MFDDAQAGGAIGGFPATHWSAVLALRSGNPPERARALETIAAACWKPVYKYIRLRWGKPQKARV